MEDLSSLGTGQGHHYDLLTVRVEDGKARLQEAGRPSDFIVRAEIAVSALTRTVSDVIGTMPELRSGISRGRDDSSAWRKEVVEAAKLLAKIHKGKESAPLREAFSSVTKRMKSGSLSRRTASYLLDGYGTSNDELLRWLERPELRAIAQHETRGPRTSHLGHLNYLYSLFPTRIDKNKNKKLVL